MFPNTEMSSRITNPEKVLNDLEILASIRPGQTLSGSSMTIVDHSTWGTAIWRTYAGETRQNTIDCIRDLLDRAFQMYDDTLEEQILKGMPSAFRGVAYLKETYAGDYETIGKIDTILDSAASRLDGIKKRLTSRTSIDPGFVDIPEKNIMGFRPPITPGRAFIPQCDPSWETKTIESSRGDSLSSTEASCPEFPEMIQPEEDTWYHGFKNEENLNQFLPLLEENLDQLPPLPEENLDQLPTLLEENLNQLPTLLEENLNQLPPLPEENLDQLPTLLEENLSQLPPLPEENLNQLPPLPEENVISELPTTINLLDPLAILSEDEISESDFTEEIEADGELKVELPDWDPEFVWSEDDMVSPFNGIDALEKHLRTLNQQWTNWPLTKDRNSPSIESEEDLSSEDDLPTIPLPESAPISIPISRGETACLRGEPELPPPSVKSISRIENLPIPSFEPNSILKHQPELNRSELDPGRNLPEIKNSSIQAELESSPKSELIHRRPTPSTDRLDQRSRSISDTGYEWDTSESSDLSKKIRSISSPPETSCRSEGTSPSGMQTSCIPPFFLEGYGSDPRSPRRQAASPRRQASGFGRQAASPRRQVTSVRNRFCSRSPEFARCRVQSGWKSDTGSAPAHSWKLPLRVELSTQERSRSRSPSGGTIPCGWMGCLCCPTCSPPDSNESAPNDIYDSEIEFGNSRFTRTPTDRISIPIQACHSSSIAGFSIRPGPKISPDRPTRSPGGGSSWIEDPIRSPNSISPSSIENIPPIVRMARVFRRWIDSLQSDSETEEDDPISEDEMMDRFDFV